MSKRRSDIRYGRKYSLDAPTPDQAASREIEAVLARVIAQAYLAEHPHVLASQRPQASFCGRCAEDGEDAGARLNSSRLLSEPIDGPCPGGDTRGDA